MNKAAKVLFVYILSLLVCSLFLSWLKLNSYLFYFAGQPIEIRAIMLPTIIGGILALKYTVSPASLKIFLVVYLSLWILRYLMLYIGTKLGEVHLFNKTFHFDLIIAGYYRTVSRLETPLPFVIYWLINYLFTVKFKPVTRGNPPRE